MNLEKENREKKLREGVEENMKKMLDERKESYQVIRIDDPDFGCEGIQEGTVPMATIYLKDRNGTVMERKERDARLYELGIEEGDYITYLNGEIEKVFVGK